VCGDWHNIAIVGPHLYAELHECPIRKAGTALGDKDFIGTPLKEPRTHVAT